MTAATSVQVISPALPCESSVWPADSRGDETVASDRPTKNVRRVPTLEDQSQSTLRGKRLVIVITSLACIIFLASFQQVSVSTSLPGIAKDFGASTAISWVGTGFLVAKSLLLHLMSFLIRFSVFDWVVRRRRCCIRDYLTYLDGKRY